MKKTIDILIILILAIIFNNQLCASPYKWRVVLKNTFPHPDDREAALVKAIAIDLDFEGNVYIVDQDKHRLLKYSPEGELIKQIGGFGAEAEQFDGPRDVFANTTLDVFVADFNNNRVVRFDKNLNFLSVLESQWPEPFNFEQVLSIAVSSQNDLFLLEESTKRIIKFSRFSQPTETFGGIYETYGQLLEPTQLAIDNSKRLFVADPAQHTVVVFDYLGNYLTDLKHPDLESPSGIGWGDDQQLYVTDRQSSQIFVFSENLKFLGIISLAHHVPQIIDIAVKFRKDTKVKLLYTISPERCWVFQIIKVPK